MARDIYEKTMALADAQGAIKALAGIEVTVFEAGTTDLATIFQNRTGATQGPTPATGAVGGPNPFVTGPSGAVEFWADGPAEFDVKLHDTQVPVRVADRTKGWNAVPADTGSIPTSQLEEDGSLGLGHMSDEIFRQFIQIGEVIDWWRPATTVPVPTGFEICDGRQILEANHDFPVAGNVNVPDLRNVFILGADASKSNGTGAASNDLATGGPGVGGSGGSQVHTLTAAQSGMPTHGHGHTLGTGTESADHTHGYSHSSSTAGANLNQGTGAFMGTFAFAGAVAQSTGGRSAAHTHGITGGISNATGVSASSAHNNMPRFVGLLKLIKVRHA
jgi:hypothetical protein